MSTGANIQRISLRDQDRLFHLIREIPRNAAATVSVPGFVVSTKHPLYHLYPYGVSISGRVNFHMTQWRTHLVDFARSYLQAQRAKIDE